eukprot:CAMPEP_0197697870 /NCGR_PEP_ID=MMETSP1338-20131121/118526_1 /TAXON_ID=43686 ORGANISM="Pelagodinium beii, Strain RCC1491" /NCGR_SAMPLE_ID=MMETSP1338 /ASSEMBLY_ACC=CAM_ASM_000754 /LENGTH=44 /DNA_ID= /DNA_START= /DNA_END= /DNA_ORIENTATION=
MSAFMMAARMATAPVKRHDKERLYAAMTEAKEMALWSAFRSASE